MIRDHQGGAGRKRRLASSAMATFPPDRRSPMMPDPITAGRNNSAVPRASPASLQAHRERVQGRLESGVGGFCSTISARERAHPRSCRWRRVAAGATADPTRPFGRLTIRPMRLSSILEGVGERHGDLGLTARDGRRIVETPQCAVIWLAGPDRTDLAGRVVTDREHEIELGRVLARRTPPTTSERRPGGRIVLPPPTRRWRAD